MQVFPYRTNYACKSGPVRKSLLGELKEEMFISPSLQREDSRWRSGGANSSAKAYKLLEAWSSPKFE
jgi:hypothetical protein